VLAVARKLGVRACFRLRPGIGMLSVLPMYRMVHSTDIVELELNSKKFKLSVKKKEALEASEPQIIHMSAPAGYAAQAPAPAPAAPVAAATTAAPAAPAAPAPAAAAPAAVDGLEVVSPMAGTMYRSPAPGEPVFCKVSCWPAQRRCERVTWHDCCFVARRRASCLSLKWRTVWRKHQLVLFCHLCRRVTTSTRATSFASLRP
jgi:biotin carboxyl carrier protein